MAYVIAEPCIGTKDTSCVDACPVDCIHPKKDEEKFGGEEMLFIDPVECIDCGACVPVCPVSAIFAAEDLPEKWSDFRKRTQYISDVSVFDRTSGPVSRVRRVGFPNTNVCHPYGSSFFCTSSQIKRAIFSAEGLILSNGVNSFEF